MHYKKDFQPTPIGDILTRAQKRLAQPPARQKMVWRGRPGEPRPMWAILGGEPPVGWQPPADPTPMFGAAPVPRGMDGLVALSSTTQQPGATPSAAESPLAPDIPAGSGPGQASIGSAYFGPGNQFDWPTEYPLITSKFGPRDLDGDKINESDHNGIDARARPGSSIYATDDGTVLDVYSNSRGGNQIRILHPDGSVSEYAHTGAVVEPGQQVRQGEVIGHSDGSGTKRPHLHYTYRPALGEEPVDPRSVLPEVPIKGQ